MMPVTEDAQGSGVLALLIGVGYGCLVGWVAAVLLHAWLPPGVTLATAMTVTFVTGLVCGVVGVVLAVQPKERR
jgi:hypothetical protein